MFIQIGTVRLHSVFVLLAGFSLLFFNLFNLNKKKQFPGKVAKKAIGRLKNKEKYNRNINLIITAEIIFISFFQYVLPGLTNSPFGQMVGTGDNYFGILFTAPIFIPIICFILGSDVFKTTDLIAPAYPLALCFTKIGCFCAGCCRGIEHSFGLLNHKTDTVEFPVQLVELFLALAIFIFMLHYRKKAKPGTLYPTYVIIYCSTRFFSEFLRCENDVFWIFKTYHLLCLAGIVSGLIQLFIVLKFADKISAFFDKSFEGVGVFIKKTAIKIDLYEEKEIVHHKKRKKK